MRAYGLPPRLPAVDLPCSVLCVAIGCGAEASPARPLFFFSMVPPSEAPARVVAVRVGPHFVTRGKLG